MKTTRSFEDAPVEAGSSVAMFSPGTLDGAVAVARKQAQHRTSTTQRMRATSPAFLDEFGRGEQI
tara:strand:+ start:159 stop:353 length:195 start_codon:yes stop_codon:yes gene_type:complete